MIDSILFGIVVSIFAYKLGVWINKKTNLIIMNPLLISIIILILGLHYLEIDYEKYNKGGTYISFFLSPATVLLAVPLYKSRAILKSNIIPIMIGILVGSVISISSVLLFGLILNLDNPILLSLLPKSVTTPIGMELSLILGGIPSLTVAFIIITGLIGAVIGVKILAIFRISDEIAIGVALGTASHAIGTSRALELGKTQGAFSGLSIGLMGLISTIVIIVTNYFIGY